MAIHSLAVSCLSNQIFPSFCHKNSLHPDQLVRIPAKALSFGFNSKRLLALEGCSSTSPLLPLTSWTPKLCSGPFQESSLTKPDNTCPLPSLFFLAMCRHLHHGHPWPCCLITAWAPVWHLQSVVDSGEQALTLTLLLHPHGTRPGAKLR